MTIEELIQDFELLTDWEDRYTYLIDLGRRLAPLKQEEKTSETKVRGCASQVWLVSNRDTQTARIYFRGESDALIVQGLIAVLLTLYSGKTPQEIAGIDEKAAFKALGLDDHLTPQRSNGLASMVARIKADAAIAI